MTKIYIIQEVYEPLEGGNYTVGVYDDLEACKSEILRVMNRYSIDVKKLYEAGYMDRSQNIYDDIAKRNGYIIEEYELNAWDEKPITYGLAYKINKDFTITDYQWISASLVKDYRK